MDVTWRKPDRPLELPPGEVHVWRSDLNPADDIRLYLESLLDDTERARADRFVFPRHRRRFVVARGLLRLLLGEYTSLPARDVTFAFGTHGKPTLAELTGALHFNVSHSGETALFAFGRDRELGVDVEEVRVMANVDSFAQRFFTAREGSAIRETDGDSQMQAFFRCWTRKEAFLKATGKGITYGLDRVEVSLGAGESPRLLSVDGDEAHAQSWTLWSLSPTPDSIGAIAIRALGLRLCCWDWSAENFELPLG